MSDFVVPTLGQLLSKPAHLVILEEKIGVAKNSHNRCFVSLEKPETDGVGFVRTKGFFVKETEDEVVVGFKEMITSIDKESIQELLIPWSKIERVRSLVFKSK